MAKRKRSPFRFILSALVIATIAVVFLACLGFAAAFALALAAYDSYARTFVPPDELAINRPSAGAKILDRNGTLLYQYVDDVDGLRKPVKLEDVSPAFLAATVATEDRNFFENPGVNPRGLARATWENFSPFNEQDGILKGTGGSSITQQLVKNVYIRQDQRFLRSIDRKLREIVYAVELTKGYEKVQILEWYVNQISYGGIYTGVEAASQGYFGKPSKDLTLGQAALLAGIPQSPAAYEPSANLPAALQRRNEVLDLIVRRHVIRIGPESFFAATPEEIAVAREEPVDIQTPVFDVEAPHFVLSYVAPQLDQIVGHEALLHDGLVITTTLDLDLQYRAQGILERRITEFERISNTHNGAALVIEPRTGEILVMLGSRDYFRDDIAGQVNNLLAPNSPGSTFKPFVYITTFDKLGWGPGTIIQDSPVSYRETNGVVFAPVNPNKQYNGPITIRSALGNSLNVPAFKAALQVGVPNIVAFAKSVGFTGLDGFYGPSIAIGGIDLKPIDLTYGYAAIANGGFLAGQDTFAPAKPDERRIEPVAILKIVDGRGQVRFDVSEHRAGLQVIRPEHAYMIADILSDPRAECITFGCGGLNVPGYRVGVKTGTSEPFDAKGPNRGKIGETWAFGFTPDFVVGIWAGNSNNAPIDNIYSTSISYRAMRDILLATYNGRPGSNFQQPPGLVARQTCVTPDPPPPPEAQPGEPGMQQAPPPPPDPVCTSELSIR